MQHKSRFVLALQTEPLSLSLKPPTTTIIKMVSKSDHELITKLIGENLLKGYTLLDESCPDCIAPLMRRKDEEAFCVYCRDVRPPKQVKSEAVLENIHKHTGSVATGGDVKDDLYQLVNNLTKTALYYSTLIHNGKNEDYQGVEKLTNLLHSVLTTTEKAIQVDLLLSKHGGYSG